MSYNRNTAPASKAIVTTLWTKLFASPDNNRTGWQCPVPAAAGTNVYFLVVPTGTTVGSDLLTFPLASAKYQAIPPGSTVDDGARAGSDVYACADAANVTLYPSEVF